MAVYEEKFIVINRKHLNKKKIPQQILLDFEKALSQLSEYLPNNKYYVVNQDEHYAKNIIKFILDNETEKEEQ